MQNQQIKNKSKLKCHKWVEKINYKKIKFTKKLNCNN